MPPRPRIPWVTIGTMLLLVALHVGIGALSTDDPREALARLWYFESPFRVWDGGAYSLLAAAFLHIAFFHLLFNLVWIWSFGGPLEVTFGHQPLFAFLFFGAVVTSGSEFALTAALPIGASALVYALFGWMLALRRRVRIFQQLLSSRVCWLLGVWFPLSLLLNLLGQWRVGWFAQPAGFLFGFAFGGIFYHRLLQWRIPSAVALLALAALTAFGQLHATWLPYWPAREYLRQPVERRADPDAVVERVLDRPLSGADYLNNIAWFAATDRRDGLRDGPLALAAARESVALVANGLTTGTMTAYVSALDTLAAAHAELGQWDAALATERRVLAIYDSATTGVIRLPRPIFEENLRLIENRSRIRE